MSEAIQERHAFRDEFVRLTKNTPSNVRLGVWEIPLEDPNFIDRRAHPSADVYSGIRLPAIGVCPERSHAGATEAVTPPGASIGPGPCTSARLHAVTYPLTSVPNQWEPTISNGIGGAYVVCPTVQPASPMRGLV